MVVQSLNTISSPAKPNAFAYSACLIATLRRKSCAEMGRQLSVSHDKLNRALSLNDDAIATLIKVLIAIAKRCSSLGKGWLIIDDTLVAKVFAKLIPGLDYHMDSSTGNYTKGLCVVAIAWTNGTITIPLGFTFWFSKTIFPEGYKTKIQLAQELIATYSSYFDFNGVLRDGLYASKDMMKFLNSRGIRFVMRMASNRVITLRNGKRVKIRDFKRLRPQRNARSRTQAVVWNGLKVYVTSEIRINKRGERSIVFLLSNYEAHSKDHVAAYKLRWNIEMIFRTSKQSLGLEECSSRSLKKQTIHIYLVFLSYAFLQNEKISRNSENVEEVLKALQASKPPTQKRLIRRLDQFFVAQA